MAQKQNLEDLKKKEARIPTNAFTASQNGNIPFIGIFLNSSAAGLCPAFVTNNGSGFYMKRDNQNGAVYFPDDRKDRARVTHLSVRRNGNAKYLECHDGGRDIYVHVKTSFPKGYKPKRKAMRSEARLSGNGEKLAWGIDESLWVMKPGATLTVFFKDGTVRALENEAGHLIEHDLGMDDMAWTRFDSAQAVLDSIEDRKVIEAALHEMLSVYTMSNSVDVKGAIAQYFAGLRADDYQIPASADGRALGIFSEGHRRLMQTASGNVVSFKPKGVAAKADKRQKAALARRMKNINIR